MYWIATVLLLLTVLNHIVEAKKNFEVHNHNITCELFGHIIESANCSIGTIRKNKMSHTTINVYFRTTEDYYPSEVHDITNVNINGQWKNLINFTADACEVFKKSLNMPLVKMITNQLKDTRKSNLNTCPLQKNKLYYLRNLYVDPDWLPPYTPTLKTEVIIDLLHKKQIIATVKVYAQMRKRENH